MTAKLERWKQLSERYFESIEPVFTDADVSLVNSGNVTAVRDNLWRSLASVRAETSQRILDEEIEIAYADLYGYDPTIRDLFTTAVATLRKIDDQSFAMLLELTQADVLYCNKDRKPVKSARLGIALRGTCAAQKIATAFAMSQVISAFQAQMIKLIQAKDQDILKQRVSIEVPTRLFDDGYASLSHLVNAGGKNRELAATKALFGVDMDKMRLEIDAMANSALSSQELIDRIAKKLFECMPTYNWVGFYMVPKSDPRHLVLGPYAGANTLHTRISMDQGICGAAASSGTTVVIDDVSKDSRYLACSVETKSEIVVPVFASNKVVGELDIESHFLSAFGEEDQTLLEYCAKIVGEFLEKRAESQANPPETSSDALKHRI